MIEGFSRLYYSHIIALNFTLMYFVAVQSGVMPFIQNAFYLVYLCLIYLFFYTYQYVNYVDHYLTGPREATRVALVGYLVYFFLASFYTLINNYIYIKSEVSAFNNSNLGASNIAKIEDFVDRLLPKHVVSNKHRSEKPLAHPRALEKLQQK